jgi:hypothetical protein
LGWTIGRNVRVDYRWYAGNADSARKYAAELVALAPDIILAPRITRAAVLRDQTNPAGIAQFGAIQALAPSLGVQVSPVNVRNANEIES